MKTKFSAMDKIQVLQVKKTCIESTLEYLVDFNSARQCLIRQGYKEDMADEIMALAMDEIKERFDEDIYNDVIKNSNLAFDRASEDVSNLAEFLNTLK